MKFLIKDIFLRILHNICQIKLTLRYFSYIYISFQMDKSWSCVSIHKIDFRKQMTTKLELPEDDLI